MGPVLKEIYLETVAVKRTQLEGRVEHVHQVSST